MKSTSLPVVLFSISERRPRESKASIISDLDIDDEISSSNFENEVGAGLIAKSYISFFSKSDSRSNC